MKPRIEKRVLMMVVVIAIALILVLTAAVYCTFSMGNAVNDQIYDNLRDVADQTDDAIEKRVELYVDLMNNLRERYETIEDKMEAEGASEEEIKKAIVQLHPYAEMNGLLRVAFCDANGDAYGSDGSMDGTTNLSDREFFTRGMAGKSTITEPLSDRMGTNETINIIASPWYADDGTIRGVFGITFYSSKMTELLQISAFEGNGGSFAINESGIIVIDATNSTESHVTKHLVTEVLKTDTNNDEETVSKIESMLTSSGENVVSDEDNRGRVYIDGTQSLYFQKTITFECLEGSEPVEWNIFTVVSMDYVNERFLSIKMDMYLLILAFAIIFVLSVNVLIIVARKNRKTVERIAYVDSVTGGDNYPMYIRRLHELKVKCGAFISMDLIEFNSVRVAVGAVMGDTILREVNAKIEKLLGDNEHVAHAGRDSFALFLAVTDEELLKHRIREISNKLLDLSQELGVPNLRVRCGVYISRYFTNETIDDCCNCAGQAREVARKKNRMYWVYSEEDNTQMLTERQLAGFFNEAIEKNEFEVWYQPKYSVSTGKIVGAEALVRWRREGQLISPGKFIPLFESNGMIAQLDEYMFRSVCRRQKLRHAAGKRVVPVSVNLSRATMYNENITDKYMGILRIYGVDVNHVQIEITESAVIGKDDLTVLLKKFRGMGEHILLDDFGTGYSSLAMLGTKCFDTLKIDKSLIDNIESDNGRTLVDSIVHMAHKLDMSVTAEGVERVEQYEELRSLDCDAIQGFYFSRPLPQTEFEALLDSGA